MQEKCNVGILSYGCGNIRSVINALECIGVTASPIEPGTDLKKFNKLVLPGVGSFGFAARLLWSSGLADELIKWCKSPTNKLLGICLGMQLLCKYSEESDPNEGSGLGIIDANISRLRSDIFTRLPNVGWSEVTFNLKSFQKFDGDYYFVHSYGIDCVDSSSKLAHSFYGDREFVSGITNGSNVFGVQFHPEKSHKRGLSLLRNFCEL